MFVVIINNYTPSKCLLSQFIIYFFIWLGLVFESLKLCSFLEQTSVVSMEGKILKN